MKYWVVCLALFAGAVSGLQKSSASGGQSRNIAILQQHPSVVQVDFYKFWSTINWSKECTASILTSLHMVSANSCFDGWSYEPRFRRIRAGSASRNVGGIVLYVDTRISHPSWDVNNYSGDVCVIRLRSPMVFGPVIQQASIASPATVVPNNVQLTQPAWGRNQQPLITSLQVTTAPRTSCLRRDGNYSNALNSTVNILCATVSGQTNDDVGGPWIFGGVTVGIVGGVNSLEEYNGIIAANVASYTEWIVGTVTGGF